MNMFSVCNRIKLLHHTSVVGASPCQRPDLSSKTRIEGGGGGGEENRFLVIF